MTAFVYDSSSADPIIHEGDKDRTVEAWLINQGGVPVDKLEWMSLWDDFGCGFVPRRNEPRPPLRFFGARTC
jgi:hypothetical protein